MKRYEIDSSETTFQAGSDDQVLANKLGITDPAEIDDIEAFLLSKLYQQIFAGDISHCQTLLFQDIARWHRQWLGNVYDWAGKVRNIDMGKGGFQFTSPLQIGRCIDLFEQEYLSKFADIPNMRAEQLIAFIARSHVEFILIHPFREGNGRISRLLIDFISYNAGIGLLDYSLWDKHKDFYIASIQAGISRDYQHIDRLVLDIVN